MLPQDFPWSICFQGLNAVDAPAWGQLWPMWNSKPLWKYLQSKNCSLIRDVSLGHAFKLTCQIDYSAACLIYRMNTKKYRRVTFVDISAVCTNFAINFTQLLHNKMYDLPPSLVETCRGVYTMRERCEMDHGENWGDFVMIMMLLLVSYINLLLHEYIYYFTPVYFWTC